MNDYFVYGAGAVFLAAIATLAFVIATRKRTSHRIVEEARLRAVSKGERTLPCASSFETASGLLRIRREIDA